MTSPYVLVKMNERPRDQDDQYYVMTFELCVSGLRDMRAGSKRSS